MTIQNPIIDAGATVSRSEAKTVLATITDIVPPDPSFTTAGGSFTNVDQSPQREGQMLFVESPDGSYVTPYIVIMTGSGLAWRRVFGVGVELDPRTGKPKDPLYDYA